MKLTPQQIARFREDGFLIAPDVVTPADQRPVIDEIAAHIDRRARELHAQGKIAELHEDKPFETRFTYLHRQCAEIGQGLDIMERLGAASFAYLLNDNLLDAVESLIGPEITCSPIQHVRAKVPEGDLKTAHGLMGNVPWHQDAGVTWEEADASEIVTVWMPLIDATRRTGCMQVLPGVFRLGYLPHVKSSYGTQIDPARIPAVEPALCECPKGGAVFMNKLTPHMGLPNLTSDTVRWTIDLRFQKTGTPTGRPFHPDFVVRSRANPASVLRDHATWARLWRAALSKPQPQAHRVKV
jgi:phytanoyl-CoA hydroxylase